MSFTLPDLQQRRDAYSMRPSQLGLAGGTALNGEEQWWRTGNYTTVDRIMSDAPPQTGEDGKPNPAYIEFMERVGANTTYMTRADGSQVAIVNRAIVIGGGGGGEGGASDASKLGDFRAQAAALFPWLTGALLDQFAQFWADSGSSTIALGRLRNTSEYDRVFAGIKRPDGTLRMDENQYFSTKAGFREALSEFGRNPGQYEGLFVKAIENEIGADELFRGMGDAYQRFFEPGSTQDNGLFDTFLNRFINTGSAQTALQEVRQSDAYANVFVGNRREDGTLRMDEAEWFAYKRGWSRTLAGFGLNPEEFLARDRLRESVEGEVSIQELNQRLQITQDGILDNIDAVRQFYAGNYGLDVSAEAILGMAIDPDIQRDVLERRITAAQIGGEASVQGFIRGIDRAEELARIGVSQTQARELYGNAARRLPALSATTQRFNLGGTSIGQFEDAALGQDSAGVLRFERAMQRESSNFSSTSDTRRDNGGGLTGLRQR